MGIHVLGGGALCLGKAFTGTGGVGTVVPLVSPSTCSGCSFLRLSSSVDSFLLLWRPLLSLSLRSFSDDLSLCL